jgi:Kef-type K+ transport system membrane component KefB
VLHCLCIRSDRFVLRLAVLLPIDSSWFAVVQTRGSAAHATAWTYASPVVGCVGSIVVGSVLCHFSPRVLRALERRVAEQYVSRLLLLLVFACAVGASLACRLAHTSELLGLYFVGLLFSSSARTQAVWASQMKRLGRWGSALFFSASVGFSVPPVGVLFSRDAAALGALLTVAGVLGKSFVGLFTRPLTCRTYLQFAAAMNARGEFNFQVTTLAALSGIISGQEAAGVTWALLCMTLITPLWFRLVFKRRDVGLADAAIVVNVPPGDDQSDQNASPQEAQAGSKQLELQPLRPLRSGSVMRTGSSDSDPKLC